MEGLGLEREGFFMLYLDSDIFFSENGGGVLEMNRFIYIV